MFNGTIPIVLDTLKQHYFIDRDGKLFRYILNYMRTSRLTLPENFDEYDSLLDEVKYYEISTLLTDIEELITIKKRKLNTCDCETKCTCSYDTLKSSKVIKRDHSSGSSKCAFNGDGSIEENSDELNSNGTDINNNNNNNNESNELHGKSNGKSLTHILNGIANKCKRQHEHSHQCDDKTSTCKILILNHNENSLYISGESTLIKSLLPELDEDNVSNHIILNSCKYATKFCLDGSLNVHYIEMMERLYNNGFIMEACYGGGLEGQQFNEYIFVKCKNSKKNN